MGNKLSSGRTKLTDLQKAYRACYRAQLKLNELKEEFNETLGFDFHNPSNEDEKEIANLAAERIAINVKLNPLNDRIYALVYDKDNKQKNKSLIAELKIERSKLFAQLSDLPDLGMSKEEWDSYDDEFKSKRLGRPSVSIELQLVRANQTIEDLLKKISALESIDGEDHKSLEDIMEMFSKKSTGRSGRPSKSTIEKLEAEIRRIDYLIMGFKEEAKTYKPRTSGRGRRSVHPLEKVARFEEKIEELKVQVEYYESKLTNQQRMDRALKKMRKEAREVKFEVSQGKKDLSDKLKEMEVRIDALDKYREYCKKLDESEVDARKPYTVSDDLILEYHNSFIKDDKELKYLPNELVASR